MERGKARSLPLTKYDYGHTLSAISSVPGNGRSTVNDTDGNAYKPLSEYVGSSTVPYTSGWCLQCGKRRGGDGRCSDCDGWWTSPLFTIGAPVIGAATLLLLFGVTLLRRQMPLPRIARASVLSSPISTADSGSVLTMRPTPPLAAPPAAPVSLSRPTAPMAAMVLPPAQSETAERPDPIRDQRRLREMTEYTGAIVRQQLGRREADAWDARHLAAVGTATATTVRRLPSAPPARPSAPQAFRQPVFVMPQNATPATPPPVAPIEAAPSGDVPSVPASVRAEAAAREI